MPVDPKGPFVLPADVVIAPVSALAESVREGLEHFGDGFAVTRPRARVPSQVLDEMGVELLEAFRSPTRIVDAVRAVSERHGLEPRETLKAAFGTLEALVEARYLVPADSPGAGEIRPTLEYGDEIGPFRIVSVLKVASDVEVLQARLGDQIVALKLARPDATGRHAELLRREAAVLEHLSGRVAPALVDRGAIDGCPYLALDWVRGVSPVQVGDELRLGTHTVRRESDRKILDLCLSIVEAYRALHEEGVLHGDVNEANILVADDGTVTLLDFAFSSLGEDAPVAYGAVAAYTSPERARSQQRREPEALTPASEQYSLAVLTDRIASGVPYLALSPTRDEFLREVQEDAPRPFGARGALPWPELETVLARALSKRPEDRFPSVSAFAGALRAVSPRNDEAPSVTSTSATGRALLDRVRERSEIGTELFRLGPRPGPTCSVNFGRAGIAYFWYRVACASGDPRALAVARAWAVQAELRQADDDAFHNADAGLLAERIGPASPHHAPAGLDVVSALIAQAMADREGVAVAVDSFLERSSERGTAPDLTTGATGTLLAAATLAELPMVAGLEARASSLGGLAAEEATATWSRLDAAGAIADSDVVRTPGIAHGWAGGLYALLRWHQAFGTPLPDGFEERLHELADLGEPAGRGLRWRIRTVSDHGLPEYQAGMSWCNGTAGLVFLWTLAYEVFADPLYLEVAERTAWNVWEGGPGKWTLCCGYAGRAYACLNAFRHLGDAAWLERAGNLAQSAWKCLDSPDTPPDTLFPDSLYKGVLGPALLGVDLDRPLEARMPFFESEGWHPTR
jgi:serine/threonine-protein kinase